MDFAKKQLEKYGWKEGKGLGKKENGIAEALKPKLKFDNSGVGHDAGEQFTNNWWERVFNSAASNINVHVDSDEVKVKLKSSESVEISTKSYSVRELKKNKNLEYGSFLKTSRATQNGVEHYNVIVPETNTLPVARLSDEELFAACGGRTAHKGARHGLKLSGKLARVEKQERMLLKKMKNVSLADEASKTIDKKVRKLKKHCDASPFATMSVQKPDTKSLISDSNDSEFVDKKMKLSKKRKSVSFNDEPAVKYYTPELDTSASSKEDNSSIDSTASSSSSYNNGTVNNNDEGIEQDFEDNNNEQDLEDNHRSFKEARLTLLDLSKAERKKLKKKRKLEKKNSATNRFLEENKEQVLITRKKRKFTQLQGMDLGNWLNDAEEMNTSSKVSKKKKSISEPEMSKNKGIKEQKLMKSIVESLDVFKISDEEQ